MTSGSRSSSMWPSHAYERRRVAEHVRTMGVDLVEEAGDARFVDGNTVVAADGRTWTAERVIVTIGGRATKLPIPGAELGLTYEDVRSPTVLPDRVCVIGGADTGCQLTSILADFGCRVSIIEYAPRIVARADQDVSAELEHAFRGWGIEVITSAVRLEPLQSGVRVVYAEAPTGAVVLERLASGGGETGWYFLKSQAQLDALVPASRREQGLLLLRRPGRHRAHEPGSCGQDPPDHR
jgi:pyruvate/2-oxoglutarate dehydrogenase complex dihydrolipoamide dehydrogenase (E3) component